jgi:hypothetical protein
MNILTGQVTKKTKEKEEEGENSVLVFLRKQLGVDGESEEAGILSGN